MDKLNQKLVAGYKDFFGVIPKIQSPTKFTEKILRRKMKDRSMTLAQLTDKAWAKGYVKKRTKLVKVGPYRIYRGGFPPAFPFVVKPNNSVGKTVVVRDDQDWKYALKIMRKERHKVWGVDKGEWAYSQVRSRTIIEDIIPFDYEIKLYSFNGKVGLIKALTKPSKKYRRPPRSTLDLFDENGKYTGIQYNDREFGVYTEDFTSEEVELFNKIAHDLSRNVDFVRIDLMKAEDDLYFGEFTFYPTSGYIKFSDPDLDEKLGAMWK